MPLHSPAFLFERITRSSTGEIVEYVRSIYRGDRYRLVTELTARGARRARRPGNGQARTGVAAGVVSTKCRICASSDNRMHAEQEMHDIRLAKWS